MVFKDAKAQILNLKSNTVYSQIPHLKGYTLEIGYGRGESFNYYSKQTQVIAIDIENKITKCKNDQIKTIKCDCHNMPFTNHQFDNVVIIFALCSVKDYPKAINEIFRVLKDNGTLIILEHIKAENFLLILFQFLITIMRKFQNKCSLIRRPMELIKPRINISEQYKKQILLDTCVYILGKKK